MPTQDNKCIDRELKLLTDMILTQLHGTCSPYNFSKSFFSPKPTHETGNLNKLISYLFNILKSIFSITLNFVLASALSILIVATYILATDHGKSSEYITQKIKIIFAAHDAPEELILTVLALSTGIIIISWIFCSIGYIYKFLTDEDITQNDDKYNDPIHDGITRKVYRRLILRNLVLREAEQLATEYCVHTELQNDFSSKKNTPKTKWTATAQNITALFALFNPKSPQNRYSSNDNESPSPDATSGDQQTSNKDPAIEINTNTSSDQVNPSLRAYNLAVTDLFVEKALAYLNHKARTYSKQGFLLFTLSLSAIAIGAFVAFNGMKDAIFIGNITNNPKIAWEIIITGFTKSFTFYGLIILIAVYAGRMGRALFDQSERMKDRRHALRQGRLFVHLNGGKLTIDELAKAFNWNTSQDNAFYHFNPEAQAPWGTMFKEMMLTLRETAKSSLELAKSVKKDG